MCDELALLILAGGRSERLDEIKSLVEIDDEPMIERVVKRISSLSDELVISCRAEERKLRDMFPEATICSDKYEEEAPLVGLVSSLPCITSEYVAVIPCDSPMIKPGVLELLFERAKGHSASVPKWPNGYLEPLTAVYRVEEFKDAAETTLKEGEMKLTRIIDRLKDVVFVSTEEIRSSDNHLESFLNLNTWDAFESNFD